VSFQENAMSVFGIKIAEHSYNAHLACQRKLFTRTRTIRLFMTPQGSYYITNTIKYLASSHIYAYNNTNIIEHTFCNVEPVL